MSAAVSPNFLDDDNTSPSDSNVATNINGLTNDTLKAIADYLPKTSKALFAVAMTAPASSWRKIGICAEPNNSSKAIIASVKPDSPYKTILESVCLKRGYGRDRVNTLVKQRVADYYCGIWDVLDFVDIEQSLAADLTDDDICAILVCIKAKDNLKRLNFTDHLTVTGSGLEPLRASTVIEKIDLDLSYHYYGYQKQTTTYMSEEAFLSLLDSILAAEGNSLKRVQVPSKWCNEGALDAFLRQDEHAFFLASSNCWYFGFEGQREFIQYIKSDPDRTNECISCHQKSLLGVCSHCAHIVCLTGCIESWQCEECDTVSCTHCKEALRSKNMVDMCEGEHCLCARCRSSGCRDGTIECLHCRDMIFNELVKENRELRGENRVLRAWAFVTAFVARP